MSSHTSKYVMVINLDSLVVILFLLLIHSPYMMARAKILPLLSQMALAEVPHQT